MKVITGPNALTETLKGSILGKMGYDRTTDLYCIKKQGKFLDQSLDSSVGVQPLRYPTAVLDLHR